ncbi:putative disease resistance RPP13-like protein 1 [Telopea speciosissima]|uniref:putative disease resistance RPP13-like protein 1 n=1 Tax=Telopea speciosissima TaxID=54955 RepID=UPI001CC3B127|nr:putative disease resistance RPP13-like protein 1 [Telopea speciosissima]
MIQALFDEAEVKQFTDGAPKLWLDHLKQLLYDAEDILDEYATELLRLKLESAHQTQQGIERSGSKVSDVNERLKGLKLESEHQTHPHQTQQVCNSVPLTPGESSFSSLLKSGIESVVQGINERFGSKVREINEKLHSVAQKGVALGLNPSMGSGSSRPRVFSERPPTGSVLNRSKVFGREEDMWKIIGWLLSDDKTPSPSNNDNNFSVLPIVGMGGAGKTTLAQLVYNDERVEKHFGLKAWVCVSEGFDVVRLTKEILESATKSTHTSNSLDKLQVELKEALSNKRFLLVLDDMWNENYERWDALSTVFAFGRPGSKILVTTRNKSVSSVVRTIPNDHDLKGLSDEACFTMVKKHAFFDENSSEANIKLKTFGQEIVKKCKGSPLVVKTLAGLLRGKRKNSEWKDILENEIWDLRESEILPSLMLSYHHLPPVLKRCFAYCALFPKNYEFKKIELALLWMAEGIVQPKGSKRLEDIGVGYFDELFMRSFFELSDPLLFYWKSPISLPINVCPFDLIDISNELHIRSFFESSSNTGSRFVMHDLIHDLAQFVSGGIFCRREYDKPSKILTTSRHLSNNPDDNRNYGTTDYMAMKRLRTLLMLNDKVCSLSSLLPTMQFQFQFLHVLCFSFSGDDELLDSIGRLKHLRLLDLSSSGIVRLPNSISSLYNLQTLILTLCFNLKELPEDMGNLINLRHLFLPMDLDIMPLGLGNLTCLQTLNRYVAGSKNNSELRDLSQLRGTLEIVNLENVDNSGTKAMVANLKNKLNLLCLQLKLRYYASKDSFPDLGKDEKVEEDVLDKLQPPTSLEALWIENYGGTRFPNWTEDPSLSNLKTVNLIGCRKCRFLPCLSQLPLLEHLMIRDCCASKMVGSWLHEDGSSSTNKNFLSLKTLYVEGMKEWEEWPEVVEEEKGGGKFPSLHRLEIRYCPKLRMFSHRFPGLVGMEIVGCHDLRELPRLLPSLQWLNISECPKLVVLPSLPSVKSLLLNSCDQITTLSDSNYPSSSAPRIHSSFPCLRVLEIVSFLTSFQKWQKNVPTFSLTIDDVLDLESPPNGVMQHLTALEELKIYDCKLLTVPLQNEIGFDLLPSSLQCLYIRFDCYSLGKLPQSMCNLNRLKELTIEGARGLTSLVEVLPNLTSLRYLRVSNCENLELLPKELHTLTSLQEFVIENCPALEPFQDMVLHKLTNLVQLKIVGCSFLMECKSFEPLLASGLHNLTYLSDLTIGGCPALVSIPKGLLPTNLRAFCIKDCPILESLYDGLSDLTSLKEG